MNGENKSFLEGKIDGNGRTGGKRKISDRLGSGPVDIGVISGMIEKKNGFNPEGPQFELGILPDLCQFLPHHGIP